MDLASTSDARDAVQYKTGHDEGQRRKGRKYEVCCLSLIPVPGSRLVFPLLHAARL